MILKHVRYDCLKKMLQKRGQQTMACRTKLAHCPQIKKIFNWNTAVPIHFHMGYQRYRVEPVQTLGSQSLNYLLFCPSQKTKQTNKTITTTKKDTAIECDWVNIYIWYFGSIRSQFEGLLLMF